MNYQDETLPEGARKVGSTPSMTEETVVPGILKKHLAPKGKFGDITTSLNCRISYTSMAPAGIKSDTQP